MPQYSHPLVQKVANWLALVQFVCAHILCDMAMYG